MKIHEFSGRLHNLVLKDTTFNDKVTVYMFGEEVPHKRWDRVKLAFKIMFGKVPRLFKNYTTVQYCTFHKDLEINRGV